MPVDKDFKRLIRQRMQKTGESYTTARAVLLSKSSKSSAPAAPKPQASTSPSRNISGGEEGNRADQGGARAAGNVPIEAYPELAGMSNDAVAKKTGRDWPGWVEILDQADATSMTHRDIARRLVDQHGVGAWWAQTITVGYERIRGLRDVGQRRPAGKKSGSYDANKSKTFPVPVARLYRCFSTKRERERWMPGMDLRVSSSKRDTSVRMIWPDGTRVNAYFVDKGPEKSSVQVQHGGLRDKATVTVVKQDWDHRLAALAAALKRG